MSCVIWFWNAKFVCWIWFWHPWFASCRSCEDFTNCSCSFAACSWVWIYNLASNLFCFIRCLSINCNRSVCSDSWVAEQASRNWCCALLRDGVVVDAFADFTFLDLSLSSALAKRFRFFAACASDVASPAAPAPAASSSSLPESASQSLVKSSWANELALEAAWVGGRDGFDGTGDAIVLSASLSVSPPTSIDWPIP